ncbi:MAG: HD domain-containing phosphohydrolase [Thermodesulfobacteriota bacterium]
MENDKTQTILFVDDETDILEMAEEYFQRKGYGVITASNGLHAAEILKDAKIDCCFTDINMPGMDGLELAEYVRKTDNTIPVIVMTGYPSLENTIRTLKNGVVDFLIKPISLNQMELCLRRVLRERELFVENIILKKEVESKTRLEVLNQELLYKVDELNILNKIMSHFTSIDSSVDIFKTVVDLSLELSGAQKTTFYVINDVVQRPVGVAAAGMDCPDGGGAGVQAVESLIMEVVADELPLLIKENNGVRDLPREILSLLLAPLKIRDKVFGVLTASICQGSARFTDKDLFYMSFMTQNAAHAIENLALYENIYQNLFATLYGFVRALEFRDAYTQQHSIRVTDLSILIGREMGCAAEELDILNVAGRLHDIGKIGIRDDILLKPGQLTESELQKVKEHPNIGADIVGKLGMWGREQQIIRCHHERFDGLGYPRGLRQDRIPQLARILFVADAFDAMTSDRAYRKKLDVKNAVQMLQAGAGTQFDPEIVKAFNDLYRKGLISQRD